MESTAMKSLMILTLCAASPALADCPVAADLAGGVRVTETTGTINLFTAQPNGRVQNDGTAVNGYLYRNLLVQGTHLAELGDTDGRDYLPDTRRTVTYPRPDAQMPVPTPNTTATYETTITTSGGSYPETQDQSWGAMTTLTIGDCSYDMIPGKITYTNTDYVVFEGLHYLPALELALLHSYQIEGSAPDIYDAATIEAVQ